jgi:peptide/nickel transport system ATP-binding protein
VSEPLHQPQRDEVLLAAQDLSKHFPARGGSLGRRRTLRAVDHVSLEVRSGETLGIVGESGCGKSTLGRCLVRLSDVTSGTVTFRGQDITHLSRRQLRPVRRDLQLVFQDPYASLNPRRRVGDILSEPLQIHHYGDRRATTARVQELLEVVGLDASHVDRFPHEFSGGQRQRVGIARALAMNPRVIVADEPVSALDVSIQAQVLNLFADLQDQFGLTYVFIAHDLGVVRHMSTRIAVMYLGEVVETATTDPLYGPPGPPLHGGPAAGGSRRGGGGRGPTRARATHRGRPEPGGQAVRLPVPHTVPARPAGLCRGAPRAAGGRAGSARGLPLPAGHPVRGRGAARAVGERPGLT